MMYKDCSIRFHIFHIKTTEIVIFKLPLSAYFIYLEVFGFLYNCQKDANALKLKLKFIISINFAIIHAHLFHGVSNTFIKHPKSMRCKTTPFISSQTVRPASIELHTKLELQNARENKPPIVWEDQQTGIKQRLWGGQIKQQWVKSCINKNPPKPRMAVWHDLQKC